MGLQTQAVQQPRQMTPNIRDSGIAAGGPPQRQPMPGQMPQGAPMQPQQMSPQQMMAGLSVVDDDIEKLDLDIPTKIMLKERELLNLAKSIQNDRMMQQQPPMQTINEQQQAQIAQMGIASQAPNMGSMMRGGGIVGYADGGEVDNRSRQVGPTRDMGDQEIAYFLRAYDMYNAAVARGNPIEIARAKAALENFSGDVRARALMLRSMYPDKLNMGGRVRGYAEGDLVEEEPAPLSWEEQQQKELYDQILSENESYDVENEITRAATEYDASMKAATEAQQQRQADLEVLRNARAERFGADREKEARRREGLATFAREGWGGYSTGSAAAEERFSAGRLQAATENFQDQGAMVDYLTTQGVNRNTAVEAARSAAMEARRGNLQTAASVINSAVSAKTQRDVATTYASEQRKPTNLQEQMEIELAYLRGLPENQGKSDEELRRQAMRNVSDMNAAAAMGRLAQTELGQNVEVRQAAMELVEKAISTMGSRYIEYQQAPDKAQFKKDLFNEYLQVLSGPETSSTTYPQPNQAAIDYLRNNPSTRGMFDVTYGPGAAAKILGQ